MTVSDRSRCRRVNLNQDQIWALNDILPIQADRDMYQKGNISYLLAMSHFQEARSQPRVSCSKAIN